MTDQHDRIMIARGEFYTEAELRAVPSRRFAAQAAPVRAADPNDRPVSAAARALADSVGVCAWCYEPGDARSRLVPVQTSDVGTEYRHPECRTEK